MKREAREHPARRRPLRLIPDLRCDECGSFGAFELRTGPEPAALASDTVQGCVTSRVDDRHLCEDCYRACGSCCLEFGADDLWTKST